MVGFSNSQFDPSIWDLIKVMELKFQRSQYFSSEQQWIMGINAGKYLSQKYHVICDQIGKTTDINNQYKQIIEYLSDHYFRAYL